MMQVSSRPWPWATVNSRSNSRLRARRLSSRVSGSWLARNSSSRFFDCTSSVVRLSLLIARLSSWLRRSSSVMSSKVASTPRRLPLPSTTGTALTVRAMSPSSLCLMVRREPVTASAPPSTCIHGSCDRSSLPCQGNSDPFTPTSSAGRPPVSPAKLLLASTICSRSSKMSTPSLRASKAARTRSGITEEGSSSRRARLSRRKKPAKPVQRMNRTRPRYEFLRRAVKPPRSGSTKLSSTVAQRLSPRNTGSCTWVRVEPPSGGACQWAR